jgi:hypothetical protein
MLRQPNIVIVEQGHKRRSYTGKHSPEVLRMRNLPRLLHDDRLVKHITAGMLLHDLGNLGPSLRIVRAIGSEQLPIAERLLQHTAQSLTQKFRSIAGEKNDRNLG